MRDSKNDCSLSGMSVEGLTCRQLRVCLHLCVFIYNMIIRKYNTHGFNVKGNPEFISGLGLGVGIKLEVFIHLL